LDTRDKSQHTLVVAANPAIKAYGRLDNNPRLKVLENTCQLLVEAPSALKLTDADLHGSSFAVSQNEEKVLSVSNHLANHVKSGVALIVHIAKYNVQESELSRMLAHQEDDKKCCICLVTDKDALFLPCRHICCCYECGQEQKNSTALCPLCRNRVTDIMKVFI